MKYEMTVDSSQIQRLIKALGGEEKKKAMYSTLYTSAKILKDETDRQFRRWKSPNTGIPLNYNTPFTVKYKSKAGHERKKVKRIATVKIDKKDYAAKVHIMADFRAKFFEMGTKNRHTVGHKIVDSIRKGNRTYLKREGKGGARGNITGSRFFQHAQRLTERRIFDNMENEMVKTLIRIGKKHGIA